MTQAIYMLTEHLSMAHVTGENGLKFSHYVCGLGHEFQPGQHKRVGLACAPVCPTCECINALINASRPPARATLLHYDEFAYIAVDIYEQVVGGFTK